MLIYHLDASEEMNSAWEDSAWGDIHKD